MRLNALKTACLLLLSTTACKRFFQKPAAHFNSMDGEVIAGVCLDQWKQQAVKFPTLPDGNLGLPDAMSADLDLFKTAIATLPANKFDLQRLSKISLADLVAKLQVETFGKSDSYLVDQTETIEFKRGNAAYNQLPAFSELLELAVYSPTQYLGKLQITTAIDLDSCARNVQAIEILRFKVTDDKATVVLSSFNPVTKAATSSSDNANPMVIASDLLAGNRKVVDAARKPSLWTDGLALRVFADPATPEASLSIRDKGATKGINAISGNEVTLGHVEIDYIQNKKVQFTSDVKFSDDFSYVIETRNNLTTESISGDTFQRLPISIDPAGIYQPLFIGFRLRDFQKKEFKFLAQANAELNFDNYAAYFDFSKSDGSIPFSYVVQTHERKAIAGLDQGYPGTVPPTYANYLKDSYYFTISDPSVQSIMTSVSKKLDTSSTYKDFVREMLKAVSSSMTYDNEAMANNAVSLMRASDALKRGKGVCQHFAAVFAAVSRGLGIPARVVSGFYLAQEPGNEEPSAGPHAWVEVLVAGNTWLPLEPQSSDFQMIANNPVAYFPMEEMKAYERTDPAMTDASEEVAKYQRYEGMTFNANMK